MKQNRDIPWFLSRTYRKYYQLCGLIQAQRQPEVAGQEWVDRHLADIPEACRAVTRGYFQNQSCIQVPGKQPMSVVLHRIRIADVLEFKKRYADRTRARYEQTLGLTLTPTD